MILQGRVIAPGSGTGILEGQLLVTKMGISFFGGVDPESGVIVERGHELEGQSIAGKILVFPTGKGSTVGSYSLYRLRHAGKAPLAILNAECETITAVGCIIAEIPCLDQLPLDALHNGQRAWVEPHSGRCLPLPAALRGLDGSFTAHTIQNRLPGIARRLIQENDWPPGIAARLQALAEDFPNGRLRPLLDRESPDAAAWQAQMSAWLGMSWMEAPWFPSEMYFFRRILEATGYFIPGEGQGIDPYTMQKQGELKRVAEVLPAFCRQETEPAAPAGPESLARLFRLGVWGNQADLSTWPSTGGSQPAHRALGEDAKGHDLTSRLLRDDALIAAQDLLAKAPGGRVAFILDNGGLELAFDLLLADSLLTWGVAQQVMFFARPYPMYVSDVTLSDLPEMLAALERSEDAGVSALARRMQNYRQSGRWQASTHAFLASPLPGWCMPDDLYRELATYDLLISKGDANYRRWLGDLHWAPEASLDEILSYLPAPWLALRVLKAEIVAGLQPGQAEELQRADPQGMVNGGWGLVHYIRRARRQ